MSNLCLLRRVGLLVAMLGIGGTAHAAGLSSCTLTLTASGKMVMVPDGQTLSTQATGGNSAFMAVVGVNLTPQIIFSSLSVTGPTGWGAAPVGYLAVQSLSGKTQPFTASTFAITPGILIDTLTLDAKITSSTGFKAGSYSADTTVTCQAG